MEISGHSLSVIHSVGLLILSHVSSLFLVHTPRSAIAALCLCSHRRESWFGCLLHPAKSGRSSSSFSKRYVQPNTLICRKHALILAAFSYDLNPWSESMYSGGPMVFCLNDAIHSNICLTSNALGNKIRTAASPSMARNDVPALSSVVGNIQSGMRKFDSLCSRTPRTSSRVPPAPRNRPTA